MAEYPHLLHTAIDTTDARALAEFYRRLLGLQYRQGDEPPAEGAADDADWLVLVGPDGNRKLAFQQVERLEPTTWPKPEVPMQMHLDFTVPSLTELRRQRERAEALGARLLDRTDDSNKPLYVSGEVLRMVTPVIDLPTPGRPRSTQSTTATSPGSTKSWTR